MRPYRFAGGPPAMASFLISTSSTVGRVLNGAEIGTIAPSGVLQVALPDFFAVLA